MTDVLTVCKSGSPFQEGATVFVSWAESGNAQNFFQYGVQMYTYPSGYNGATDNSYLDDRFEGADFKVIVV